MFGTTRSFIKTNLNTDFLNTSKYFFFIMINFTPHPIIFEIGFFKLRWYSLAYIIGFLIAYYVLIKAADKKLVKNLTRELVDEFLIWLILGSILLSRLTYVFFYNPSFFFHNPLESFMIWHGGLSIHGGLVGAIIIGLWFCKKHKIKFYQLADLLVIPLGFALFLGRLANLMNGELYGTITNVPWCFNFPGVQGCRHPSQIYEALYSLLIGLILLPLYLKNRVKKHNKKIKDGFYFWLFILLYGVFRFLTNFYRAPDFGDPLFLGLAKGQWLNLTMIIISIGYFLRQKFKKNSKNN